MKILSSVLVEVAGEPTIWCPGCRCPHRLSTHAPAKNGARWTWDGSTERPTFYPSIHIPGLCHSFVRQGMIQFLPDCDHALAGQTQPLPVWPEGMIDDDLDELFD